MHRRGFTLIELLVVIAIVAVLAVVVVLVLNPAQLLQQARDSNRLSDLATINAALGYFRTDQASASLGNSSTSYISVLDPSATSTAGDQCQGLVMPSLGSSTWQCAASSTYRKSDGTGWIPAALSSVSYGTPLAQLPVDPNNTTSSGLFYGYATNGSQYEVTSGLESSKYKLQFATSPQIPGYPEVAALGSSLTLSPLWNPNGLVGYWPMDEGSGSSTNDLSGNSNKGTWNGSTTNGSYYTAGKVGVYAGIFDGTSTYMSAADAASLNPTTAMTFSFWLYTFGNTSPDGYMAPLRKNDSAGYMPRINGLTFDMAGIGSFHRNTGGTLPINTWTFFAMTYDGAVVTNYVNGVSAATTAVTSTINAAGSALYIGGRMAGGTNNEVFNGYIDDTRVYNRSLSPAEIVALYNSER